jgi:hypothetical protein
MVSQCGPSAKLLAGSQTFSPPSSLACWLCSAVHPQVLRNGRHRALVRLVLPLQPRQLITPLQLSPAEPAAAASGSVVGSAATGIGQPPLE